MNAAAPLLTRRRGGVVAGYNVAQFAWELSAGSDGGDAIGGDTWQSMPLNVERFDPDNLATLNAGIVTIDVPGEYNLQGWVSGYAVGRIRGRIYDVDAASEIEPFINLSQLAREVVALQSAETIVSFRSNLTVGQRLELQCLYAVARLSDGLGLTENAYHDPVFAILTLEKLD